MTRTDIEAAVSEARRFIARADDMLQLMQEYEDRNGDTPPESGHWPIALKRASLDLIRSLVQMRQHKKQ